MADTTTFGTKMKGDEIVRARSTVHAKKSVVNFDNAQKRFNRGHGKSQHESGHGHGHGHGHDKGPSVLNAIASAVINFMLMFGLCAAYGMIMFSDDWNGVHRGLGVKMNLSTAAFMGLLLACFSKIPVAIGGPDLNPVVFIGGFIETIAATLAEDLNLVYPEDRRRLFDGFSGGFRLLASSTVEFCSGDHLIEHAAACKEYHEQLRATTIFATAASTGILMFLYFTLGQLKLTKLVSYIPTNIVEAFLSCIGFKVFKYALKFCKYEAKQFIPAAFIGVPLYLLKAMHVGNPALVLPLGLLVPLGAFYGLLYATGSDVKTARKDKLMFPEIANAQFWEIWTESIGNAGQISIKAWTKTFPDLAIMIIVCVLDNLLKLNATESKLPVKVDKDYEIKLHGVGNILLSLCGSSVGYMQLKFNVINFGVMGNCTDRRGGIFYALVNGICFFWSIELANYMPRFFLSALLFFAGAGFVAENLWGSRKYLSAQEWGQVVAILLIFVLFNSLLYAVVGGGLIVGAMFIMKYAKVPCIIGKPQTGYETMSSERKAPALQRNLQLISGHWLLVVRLKGFLFFASAQNLVKDLVHELHFPEDERSGNIDYSKIPKYRRVKFLIFDVESLDDMDSSAGKALAKFIGMCTPQKVKVLWSSVTETFSKELKKKNVLTEGENWYSDLDEALLHVEDEILQYRQEKEKLWRERHPTFQLAQDLVRQRECYQPFDHMLEGVDAHFLCPWNYCGILEIEKFKTQLWEPGELGRELYLVHSGAVAIFERMPTADIPCMPLAIYRHGWFLNREALLRQPTRHFAVAVEDGELISFTMKDWARMEKMASLMADKLQEENMKQLSMDMDRLARAFLSIEQDVFPDEPIDADPTLKKGGVKRISARSKRRQMHARASSMGLLEDEKRAEEAKELQGKGPDRLKIDRRCLEGIHAAQHLESFGFFDQVSPHDSELPPLPSVIRMSLETAFEAFKDPLRAELSTKDLIRALLFAGVYNCLIYKHEDGFVFLTQQEFIAVGHEAAMARFSPKQVQKCCDLFEEVDTDGSGGLDPEEVHTLLCKIFGQILTLEDSIALTSNWTDAGNDMSVEQFTGFMSRITKKYAVDWMLLGTIKDIWEVVEEEDFAPRHSMHVSRFQENLDKGVVLSCKNQGSAWKDVEVTQRLHMDNIENYKELLWASGCGVEVFSGQNVDLLHDCAGIAAALSLYTDETHGRLPELAMLGNQKNGRYSTNLYRGSTFRSSQLSNVSGNTFGSNAVEDDQVAGHVAKVFQTDPVASTMPPSCLLNIESRVKPILLEAHANPQCSGPSSEIRRRRCLAEIEQNTSMGSSRETSHGVDLERERLLLEERLRQIKELQSRQISTDHEVSYRPHISLTTDANHMMIPKSPKGIRRKVFSNISDDETTPPEKMALEQNDTSQRTALLSDLDLPDNGSISESRKGSQGSSQGSNIAKAKKKVRKLKRNIPSRCSLFSPRPSDNLEVAHMASEVSVSEKDLDSAETLKLSLDVIPSLPQEQNPQEQTAQNRQEQFPQNPQGESAQNGTSNGSVPKVKKFSNARGSALQYRKPPALEPQPLPPLTPDDATWQKPLHEWVFDYRDIPRGQGEDVQETLDPAKFLELIVTKSDDHGGRQSQSLLPKDNLTTLKGYLGSCESLEPPPPPTVYENMNQLLNDPFSGPCAKLINTVMMCVIILSFVDMHLEAMICKNGEEGDDCRDHPEMWVPELVLCSFSITEYFARMAAAWGLTFPGSRKIFVKFLKDPMNAFDILSTVPAFAHLIFGNPSGILSAITFFKLCRIARLMRVQGSFIAKSCCVDSVRRIIQPVVVVLFIIWGIFIKEFVKI